MHTPEDCGIFAPFASMSAKAKSKAPTQAQTTVGLISLGCAKNLIDSEIMIGCLQKAGMVMTPEAELADVLIINTCSFIDQAKKESIDTIL
ncbi:MAG: ribosomal protein S12 methylthiotransferase, partial [Verrucomicrobia bacterium]